MSYNIISLRTRERKQFDGVGFLGETKTLFPIRPGDKSPKMGIKSLALDYLPNGAVLVSLATSTGPKRYIVPSEEIDLISLAPVEVASEKNNTPADTSNPK